MLRYRKGSNFRCPRRHMSSDPSRNQGQHEAADLPSRARGHQPTRAIRAQAARLTHNAREDLPI